MLYKLDYVKCQGYILQDNFLENNITDFLGEVRVKNNPDFVWPLAAFHYSKICYYINPISLLEWMLRLSSARPCLKVFLTISCICILLWTQAEHTFQPWPSSYPCPFLKFDRVYQCLIFDPPPHACYGGGRGLITLRYYLLLENGDVLFKLCLVNTILTNLKVVSVWHIIIV